MVCDNGIIHGVARRIPNRAMLLNCVDFSGVGWVASNAMLQELPIRPLPPPSSMAYGDSLSTNLGELHVSPLLDQVPHEDLRFTQDEIPSDGLSVVVSEVDIGIHSRSKGWSEDERYCEELSDCDLDHHPDDVLQRQAEQLPKLFEVYAQKANSIELATFWSLQVGRNRLNDFPWQQFNFPVLFARNLQLKPAYLSVTETLQEFQSSAAK